MLIEVEPNLFKECFPYDPHPFLSDKFIELNRSKVEGIIRLIDDSGKPAIGLIAGLKEGILKIPFSAPFGGFHYRNEIIYISEIDIFLEELKKYIITTGRSGFDLVLPPNIYQETIISKTINCLIRNGFEIRLPEITNWVDLRKFDGQFSQKNSREYYRQSVRNGLEFNFTHTETEMVEAYELICDNRKKFGRPIYMSFADILATSSLWPVDFFNVRSRNGDLMASAIFYRYHPKICYAVFWGDNDEGRINRAMDFLVFNLWSHYKDMGYTFIDLGISTETGYPNQGLLRFKESHDATSSLRFGFSWKNPDN